VTNSTIQKITRGNTRPKFTRNLVDAISGEFVSRTALVLTSVFLSFLLLPVRTPATTKIIKEAFDSHGRKRTYYIFVPDSVKQATSVPLIVLLHGSGRNGLSLVEKWKDLANHEGVIIVGPDSSDSRGWRMPENGPDFLHDLVEMLKAKFPINPRRVYLFGHSAGAVLALNLSMMESEYFAATAVHAGSWREEKDLSLMQFAKRKTPLAIFVGDRDAFFPLSSVKATEVALKGAGFPVEVTVMKGHDHWYYDLAPEINRSAWDFLKRQELNEDPIYATYSGPKEADEFNSAVKDINALRLKAHNLVQRFHAKESELAKKDFVYEKDAIARIAREQMELLAEGVAAFRESALKAERASKLKLGGNYSRYFSLIAELERKRAEALEATRERASLLLSDGPADTVTNKMNEAAGRAERLNKEADELQQKAEALRTTPGPR
jgi:predicted esterase